MMRAAYETRAVRKMMGGGELEMIVQSFSKPSA